MAAGATYEPIATQTLGSAAASITFSSIPNTYTDLVLIVNSQLTGTGGVVVLQLQFNSDTGTNYSETSLTGDGTSASSARGSNRTTLNMGLTDSAVITTSIINILNYSNTTTYKTALGRGNTTSYGTRAVVGLWRSTSAINSVYIQAGSVNFAIGTTATLYGIKAA